MTHPERLSAHRATAETSPLEGHLEPAPRTQEHREIAESLFEGELKDISITFGPCGEKGFKVRHKTETERFPAGRLPKAEDEDESTLDQLENGNLSSFAPQKLFTLSLTVDPEKITTKKKLQAIYEEIRRQYHGFLESEGFDLSKRPDLAMRLGEDDAWTIETVGFAFSSANAWRVGGFHERIIDAFNDPESNYREICDTYMKAPPEKDFASDVDTYDEIKDGLEYLRKEIESARRRVEAAAGDERKDAEVDLAKAIETLSKAEEAVSTILYKITWDKETMRFKSGAVKPIHQNAKRILNCVGVSWVKIRAGEALGLKMNRVVIDDHAFVGTELANGKTFLDDHVYNPRSKMEAVDMNNPKAVQKWCSNRNYSGVTQGPPAAYWVADVLAWMASWAKKGGDTETAVTIRKRALDFDPDSRTRSRLARALYTEGEKTGNMGMFEEAILHYNKILEQDPYSTWDLMYKGRALAKLGQVDDAKRMFQEAIRTRHLSTKSPDAHTAYIRFLFSEGKYDEAERAFETAMQEDGDCANIPYQYALMIISRAETETDRREKKTLFQKSIDLLEQAKRIANSNGVSDDPSLEEYKRQIEEIREKMTAFAPRARGAAVAPAERRLGTKGGDPRTFLARLVRAIVSSPQTKPEERSGTRGVAQEDGTAGPKAEIRRLRDLGGAMIESGETNVLSPEELGDLIISEMLKSRGRTSAT